MYTDICDGILSTTQRLTRSFGMIVDAKRHFLSAINDGKSHNVKKLVKAITPCFCLYSTQQKKLSFWQNAIKPCIYSI